MSDWLSEIEEEEDYTQHHDDLCPAHWCRVNSPGYGECNCYVQAINRMARVIRELARYARKQEGRIHTWNVNKKNAREKAGLSPGAKELLK